MKNILIFAFLAPSLMLGAAERMIYVARHCQAFSKGPDVIRPIAGDAGITPLGVRQAQLLGKRLKELNFSGKIYASPYFRTVATACHAAEQCGAKVYPDARVQERVHRDGGNLKKGADLQELQKLYPDTIAADARLPQPWLYVKEEPQKTTAHRERMAKALDEILKETSGDIMIVSHAGAVGALAEEMSARTGSQITGMTWNCALFKYAVNEQGKFRFAGYESDFMPPEAITSNMRKPGDKKKVRSGVDIPFTPAQ